MRIVSLSLLKPPRSEGKGQGNSVPLWGLRQSPNRPSAQYMMNPIYDAHAHRFIKPVKTAAKRRGRSRELSSLVGFEAKPQSSFRSAYDESHIRCACASFNKFLKTAAKRRGRSRELSSLVGFGAKPQSSFRSVYHIRGQLTKPAAAGTMKLTQNSKLNRNGGRI